jgi:hypothetical protein
MMVIARVSNRVFMGLPLCRNKRFLDLNIGFTIKVVISVITLNLLPKFLKPYVLSWITHHLVLTPQPLGWWVRTLRRCRRSSGKPRPCSRRRLPNGVR